MPKCLRGRGLRSQASMGAGCLGQQQTGTAGANWLEGCQAVKRIVRRIFGSQETGRDQLGQTLSSAQLYKGSGCHRGQETLLCLLCRRGAGWSQATLKNSTGCYGDTHIPLLWAQARLRTTEKQHSPDRTLPSKSH